MKASLDAVDLRRIQLARTAVAIVASIGFGFVLGLTFIERACGVDADLCTDVWSLAGMPALWALLLPVTLGHWAYRCDAPTGFVAAVTGLGVATMATFAVQSARLLVRLQPLLEAFGAPPTGFLVVWGCVGIASGAALWWLPIWIGRRLPAPS